MKPIYIHLAEGFEEIEAITIIDVLRRAALNILTVSVTGEQEVNGSHGIPVKADLLFEKVKYEEAQMIILPGGMPGSRNLMEHQGLRKQLLSFNESGKYIGAICAAPMVLGDLGILKGKNAVCYPGFEGNLKGAKVQTQPTVIDGNIITGRGVGAAHEFSLKIVSLLKGPEASLKLRQALLITN
jgi:4-methyl-5(b-hydroxyethyl)-thiazole monophosphate biosynthesis